MSAETESIQATGAEKSARILVLDALGAVLAEAESHELVEMPLRPCS